MQAKYVKQILNKYLFIRWLETGLKYLDFCIWSIEVIQCLTLSVPVFENYMVGREGGGQTCN